MTICLKECLKNPGTPMKCVTHITGGALPVLLPDVPQFRGAERVTGVKVSIVNADGLETVADCEQHAAGWSYLFPAALFAHHGFVQQGVKVALVLGESGGVPVTETVALGDIDITPASASVHAGEPEAMAETKGGDKFDKTRVVDGVQHYAKRVVSYDEEMGAYGATWVGDYVLGSDGQFVEVE